MLGGGVLICRPGPIDPDQLRPSARIPLPLPGRLLDPRMWHSFPHPRQSALHPAAPSRRAGRAAVWLLAAVPAPRRGAWPVASGLQTKPAEPSMRLPPLPLPLDAPCGPVRRSAPLHAALVDIVHTAAVDGRGTGGRALAGCPLPVAGAAAPHPPPTVIARAQSHKDAPSPPPPGRRGRYPARK